MRSVNSRYRIRLSMRSETCSPLRTAIPRSRTQRLSSLGQKLKDELLATYRADTVPGPYSPDAVSAGKRSLRNLCLAYLMETRSPQACDLVQTQFESADNMTDAL